MRGITITAVLALVCTPFAVITLQNVDAEVRSSTNYQLESDSINFGGGLSESDGYVLESTAGEVATGNGASDNYNLRAGYQQLGYSYISISGAETVSLSPSIPGVAGGTSNGSTTVQVATDNAAGYSLSISAENSPAMQSGANTIADYVPADADPDYNFETGDTDAHFGYTPEGEHVVQRFLDDGGECNASSGETTLACWDGLNTTGEVIASDTVSNHPLGTETTIRFRVGVGGSVLQTPGIYTATTTLTALPL